MRVDTTLRYFAIEIGYPPMTKTTAFAAKQHSYPPNLKTAISNGPIAFKFVYRGEVPEATYKKCQ